MKQYSNKIIKTSLLLLLSAVLFGYGCASQGGDGAGSCKETTYCTDYIGADYSPDSVKSSCLGTYSEDACASGSYGSCIVNGGQANETKITYITDDNNAGKCSTSGGSFVN